MTLKSINIAVVGLAIPASNAARAHPGHEPDDLLHAIARELASPRSVIVLLSLGVAGVLWFAHKSGTRK